MKSMYQLKRALQRAVACIGVLLVVAAPVSAATPVNYLLIQSSGNTSSAAISLTITSAQPPGGSTIHLYGQATLVMPQVMYASGANDYYSQYPIGATTTSIYVAGVPSQINVTNLSTGATTAVVLAGATINIGNGIVTLPDGFVVGTQLSGYSNPPSNYVYNLTAAHPAANFVNSAQSGCCGTYQTIVWTTGLTSNGGSAVRICTTDGAGYSAGYVGQKCSLTGAVTHAVGY